MTSVRIETSNPGAGMRRVSARVFYNTIAADNILPRVEGEQGACCAGFRLDWVKPDGELIGRSYNSPARYFLPPVKS